MFSIGEDNERDKDDDNKIKENESSGHTSRF
jgi:hypothetical protein